MWNIYDYRLLFLQQVLHHADLRAGKDQTDIAEPGVNDALKDGIDLFRFDEGAQVGVFVNDHDKLAGKRIEKSKHILECVKGG